MEKCTTYVACRVEKCTEWGEGIWVWLEFKKKIR